MMAESTLAVPQLEGNEINSPTAFARGLGSLSVLPLEIRNDIYGYVLLSKLHVSPYLHPSSLTIPPDLALFFVSKDINAEATANFFAKVTFYVEADDSLSVFLTGCPEIVDQTNIISSRFSIRHLWVDFLPKSSEPSISAVTYRYKHIWEANPVQARPQSQPGDSADYDQNSTRMAWTVAIINLERLALFGNLKLLTLDFSHNRWLHNCGWLHQDFVCLVKNGLDLLKEKISLTVYGRFNVEELGMLKKATPKAKFMGI